MARLPAAPLDRDRFVVARRPPRPRHDPWRPHGVVVEDERAADGSSATTATVFLTGRECPWRCVMCDLWRFTTETATPAGAIPSQIRTALSAHRPPVVKLYNAGSFFDPRAVPPGDYDAIADALGKVDRVIVESHPSLVGARTWHFQEMLAGRRAAHGSGPETLEVAVGLETVHPEALEHLNKKMTVDDFRRAADRLAAHGVALRVFLLVSPPFVAAGEQDEWLARSVDAAIAAGATAISLIPTRSGNGAMEAIAADGYFDPPTLADLERSVDLALDRPRAAGVRIFADLWDLDRFSRCPACFDARRRRLHQTNREQRRLPAVACQACQ